MEGEILRCSKPVTDNARIKLCCLTLWFMFFPIIKYCKDMYVYMLCYVQCQKRKKFKKAFLAKEILLVAKFS